MIVDFKTILSASASVTTILLFLGSLSSVYKIYKRKSIGDDSCAPYTTNLLSCVLWSMYGVLIEDGVIQFVNAVGVVVQTICVNVYIRYSPQKTSMALKQALVVSIAIPIKMWALSSDDEKEAITRVGLAASIVSVAFFAAPLTKLMHVIRTANTECLPFQMIAMSFVVSLQWTLYGMVLDDALITIQNALGCLLSSAQLFLFLKYPSIRSDLGSPKKEPVLVA